MKIDLFFIVVLLCLVNMNCKCYSGDNSEQEVLQDLTRIKGNEYLTQRNIILSNLKSLQNLLNTKPTNSNEILQQRILRAWSKNYDIYRQMIKGFGIHENVAKTSIVPFSPRPMKFAQSWNKQAGDKLVFVAIEIVWKYDNWAEWRILAMLEIIKSHADDEMLPVIADRLLTEKNKKIITSIVQVLKTRAGKKTLEHLKSLAKNKNGNNELILDCVKTITDRMSTDKKQ